MFLSPTEDFYATIPVFLRDVLPIIHLLDKISERKSQTICMTPTVYGSFMRSHHFQKQYRSRNVQTFLPHDQLDVIDDNGHLSCGFIHQAFPFKFLAQSVFAIQVNRIEPSSVDIAKSLFFVKEDMEEYTIQLPTSMTKVERSIPMLLRAHTVLAIRQCFPSSNQEQEAADTLTKALMQNTFFWHRQAMCGQ